MRIICLSDGRICHVKQGYTEREVPVGATPALATIAGRPRFGLLLPENWGALTERELRGHVETWLRSAPAEEPAEAPTSRGPGALRGVMQRLFAPRAANVAQL